MTENDSKRVVLTPHVYPLWIKISIAFLGILFIYTFFLIPKILQVRKDVLLSDDLFKSADKLFNENNFKEAIPIYKKGLYLNGEGKPEKLAICYLEQGDSLSVLNALGILDNEGMDSVNAFKIRELLPQQYHSYLKRSQTTYKKKAVLLTWYLYDFSEMEKENYQNYRKIQLAKEDFNKFIQSNPNN